MRSSFRQGILRHGKTPEQAFFLQVNGQYVDLISTSSQTIVGFADDTKDYLFTESFTVLQAWGPFTIAQDYWLYWELNKATGVRTFGSTTLLPIVSPTEPVSPVAGQMWFDTSTGSFTSMKMNVYNGASWRNVLRVLVCKMSPASQFLSPIDNSSIETNFIGSQIGAVGNVTINIGALAYDAVGLPIINQSGKFFTTEDSFTSGVPSGASLKINDIILRGQTTANIAEYQVVEFSNYNKFSLASPFNHLDKIYGLVEEDVIIDDFANVVLAGIITNEAWDFSDTINNPSMSGIINSPIYVSTTGELTTDISQTIATQVAIGAVLAKQTILFQPGLFGTIGAGLESAHSDLAGLLDDDHPQYYNQLRGDIRYYTQGTVDTLLNSKVDIAGDTMTGVLVLDADPANPLEAATKQYVDAIPILSAGTNINFVGTVINVKDVAGGGTVDALTWNSQTITIVGSPVPADGDVLTYNSGTWENQTPTGSGLPTSTQQCNILIADGAGGWTELPILELPHPYDISSSSLGTTPDNSTIYKFVSTQKFKLFDYGHKAHFTDGGVPSSVTANTTFTLFINGTQKGIIGLFAGGNTLSSFDIGDGGPNGNTNYSGSLIDVVPGDVITIISPVTADVNMTDVSISLRGFIEPAAADPDLTPSCSIGISFDKDSSIDEFYNKSFDTMTVTYTGSISYVEWSVPGFVDTGDWPPSIDGDIYSKNSSGFQRHSIEIPGVGSLVDFDDGSMYQQTTTFTSPDISNYQTHYTTDKYVMVRCTAFGPAGIATDTAWVFVPAISS